MAIDTLSPDVLASEVQGNSSQVPNASTSAFAMAGYSPRGPEDQAIVSTSFQQFAQTFGGFNSRSLNGYAAAAYFQNGGNQLIFTRKLHSDAQYASGQFDVSWAVKASGRGVWADGAQVVISGNPNYYNSVSGTYSAFDVSIALIDPTTNLLAVSETYQALDFTDPTDPDYIVNTITAESQDVVFTAVSGGIPAALQPVLISSTPVATGVSGQSLYTGSVSGAGIPIIAGTFEILTNSVVTAEDDGNGNLVPVAGGPSVSGQINYSTGALTYFVSPSTSGGEAIAAAFTKAGAQSVSITLSGGNDGSAVLSSDILDAALQPAHQGIYALDLITQQFSLALPDYAGDATTDLLMIQYAEGRADLDVLVIVQPPSGSTPQQAASYKRNTLQSISSFGAMYYPWVKIPDALNKNRPKLIPPCAHVAGRYAYTDLNANVGKAPAGTDRGQLSYILAVERVLSKPDRDIVYQAQVNPIRSDSQVGIAVWGNKTLQIVGDYTDVNIRRLFIYLRKTQEAGLIDITFDDVGPATYGLITARLDSFLEGLWLNNVIGSGVTNKAQAYKVVCDESNNPPAIQEQKMIIIDEYIKPDLASEVIWLRLQRVLDASQLGS